MASVGRKSSMMDRLRQLRTSSIQNMTSSLTSTATSTKVAVPAHRAPEAKKSLKPALKSKSKSKYRDEALDLEQVNSKLEAIALQRSQSQEDDDEDEPSESEAGQVEEVETHKEGQANTGGDGQADTTTAEANNTTKASQDDRATSERSKSTCPSIVITPPDDDPVEGSTEPTDFQLFLQQAEVQEDTRKKLGHTAIPKAKPEPSLNPFYSNNLASSTSAPTPSKLAEIHEIAEGHDNGPAGEEEQHAVESAAASSNPRSSITASSGSHDFAATETHPARANTASLGRHVSFSEPQKAKKTLSHSSAYHGRGCDSPSPEALRSASKRRSIRAMFKNCLRLA